MAGGRSQHSTINRGSRGATGAGSAGFAATGGPRECCPEPALPRRRLPTPVSGQIRTHPVQRDSAGESSDTLATAVAERFYLAQCAKDETMAESIVSAADAVSQSGVVVHFTGAFHSDYSQGTVERVRRRDPRLRVVVLTGRPVDDPAAADVEAHRERADFVIFTRRPWPG